MVGYADQDDKPHQNPWQDEYVAAAEWKGHLEWTYSRGLGWKLL